MGLPKDKAVDPAVGFLTVLKAIPRRYVAVTIVKSLGEVRAFAHVPNFVVNREDVDPAPEIMAWNLKLAKGPSAVAVEWQPSVVAVSALRQMFDQSALCVSRRQNVANKLELATFDPHNSDDDTGLS